MLVHLSRNQVFHERTKHIDVRLHLIRDILSDGKVRVEKVATEENATDMITKVVPTSKFQHCLELLGIEQEGP